MFKKWSRAKISEPLFTKREHRGAQNDQMPQIKCFPHLTKPAGLKYFTDFMLACPCPICCSCCCRCCSCWFSSSWCCCWIFCHFPPSRVAKLFFALLFVQTFNVSKPFQASLPVPVAWLESKQQQYQNFTAMDRNWFQRFGFVTWFNGHF